MTRIINNLKVINAKPSFVGFKKCTLASIHQSSSTRTVSSRSPATDAARDDRLVTRLPVDFGDTVFASVSVSYTHLTLPTICSV